MRTPNNTNLNNVYNAIALKAQMHKSGEMVDIYRSLLWTVLYEFTTAICAKWRTVALTPQESQQTCGIGFAQAIQDWDSSKGSFTSYYYFRAWTAIRTEVKRNERWIDMNRTDVDIDELLGGIE